MSLYGTGRREACIAVGVLALLAFVAQAPALLGWTSASPPSGEAAVTSRVLMPAIADAAAVLAQGEWPWWNPFARFGEPFVATGVQPLYPGFWPLLAFGAGALPTVMALHAALGALLMYRFVRALPTSRYVAFLGGGLWSLGWFFQAQLDRLPDAAACAWLPLALESVWRLVRPGNRRGATAALAVGLAAMLMTGGTAVPRVGLLALAFVVAWNLHRLGPSDRLAAGGSLALATLGAALLSAPRWLDAMQFQAALQPGEAVGAPLPPGALLGAVSPTLLSYDALRELGSGRVDEALALALFPGTAALLFVLLGFVRPSPAQPRWPWLALALFGVVLVIDVPGAGLLRELVGLASARPGAALLLVHLGVLVLACNGLDAFLDAPYRRPVAVPLVAAATILAAGATAGALWLGPELTGATMLGWLDSDAAGLEAAAGVARRALLPTASVLLLLGAMFFLWRRMGVLRFKQALAVVVLAEVLTFAVLSSARRELPTESLALSAPTQRVLALDEPALRALDQGAVRVRGINRGGDAMLRRTAAFLDEVAPGALVAGERVRAGVPNRLAVSPHLAALGQIDVAHAANVTFAGNLLDATAVPDGANPRAIKPVPWARFVFDAITADSPARARAALHALAGTPEIAVLENIGAGIPLRRDDEARVEVLARGTCFTHLRADARRGSGWLVIAEAYAPGWQAFVDGEQVPIATANVAFQAIPIPPGAHEVTLRYRPWSQRAGLPLALLGALLCIALVAIEQRRPPRAVEFAPPRILKKQRRSS